MFRYIRVVIICFFDIVFSYFGWMIPFSRHPERWPLAYRYGKLRKLVLKIVKHLHVDYHLSGESILKEDGVRLYVANHYSMYDALVTVSLSEQPILFVGKNEIRKFPFFGRIMKGMDCVFLERDNLRKEIEVLKQVKKSLADGKASWIIYPEGTRNKDWYGPLLPFKAGTFKMALDTKRPIVPMAMYGGHRPLNTKFHLKRYPIQIAFLEPIYPDQYAKLNSLQVSTLVRDRMQEEVNRLRTTDTALVAIKALKQKRK